jgi:hypothetical protein
MRERRAAARPAWLRGLCLGLALGCACALVPAPAAGQTIDLSYSYLTGSFGTAAQSEVQQLRLGVEWGERARFRVVVPGVSGRVPVTVVRTGLGQVSRERLRRAGIREPPTMVETRAVSGLGDVRFGLAVPVAGGGARRYRLEVDLDAKAPTAAVERNLGTGEWDARAGLFAEYALWSATLFGAVGYNLLGDPPGLELANVPDALFGIEREPLPSGIRLAAWVEGHPQVVRGAGGQAVAAAGVGGAGRHPWRLVVRAGLTGASEDLVVELGYSLRPSTLRRQGP